MYILFYAFSVVFISGEWLQFPALHGRTLFIHPKCHSLHLPTPDSRSIPSFHWGYFCFKVLRLSDPLLTDFILGEMQVLSYRNVSVFFSPMNDICSSNFMFQSIMSLYIWWSIIINILSNVQSHDNCWLSAPFFSLH